jgi:hypothetical protein
MMKSFSEHSRAIALVLVVAASIAARADTLVTKDASFWGSVISIKDGSVTFRSGCTGADTQVAWSSVLIVQFDHNCKSGTVKLPTAPLLICKKTLVHIFKVRISGQYLYLTSVSMAPDSDLRGVPYGKRGWIRLKKNKVDSIQPTDICPSLISELDSFPKGICFEPEQWAVNWSVEPVFNNQIFTKGFAIYVSSESSLQDEVTEKLRVAFGTALSLWASTLQEHRNELPADLRSYVDRSTSSSSKYVLYTPPQVIRVSCRENALLIVNWVTKRNEIFPRGQGYVARAQLQGRTILLNASEYQFGYRPDFLNPLAPDVINLISVFVHELGHCLGLPDDSADPGSVMNPNHVASMINETVSPSPGDFRNFVTSLRASVSGTSPGFFDVKDCAGLVVKKRTGGAKG